MNYLLIDTNIFVSKKFDVAQEYFTILTDLVSNEEVIVLYNDILLHEYKNNIDKMINVSTKIITAGLKQTGSLLSKYKPNEEKNNKEISKNFEKYWINNIKETFCGKFFQLSPKQIEISKDVDSIFKNYFEVMPPFENKNEKKTEFPDAFIAYSLKDWKDKNAGEEDDVYIITQDKGMKCCCKSLDIKTFDSLESFYDLLNSNSNFEGLNELLKRKLNETISDNITEDQIMIDNNDNDEEVEDIRDIYVGSLEYDVLKIEKGNVIFSAVACVGLSVVYNYKDYGTSIWDSEEKVYLRLPQETNELEREVELRFLITVCFNPHFPFNQVREEDTSFSIEPDFSSIDIYSDRYLY